MILYVGGTTFRDDNDEGNEVGEQLKVGPRNTGGVSVTRKYRALADSPTLRDLIAFKNTHNRAKTLGILIQNDYGTDTTEVVKGTAHVPGLSFQTNDRWLLVARRSTPPPRATRWPSPTPGTAGGAAESLVEDVTNDIPNADGCLGVSYRISVPANSTKYLLLFAQVHDASAVADAKDDARVFDRKTSPGRLPARSLDQGQEQRPELEPLSPANGRRGQAIRRTPAASSSCSTCSRSASRSRPSGRPVKVSGIPTAWHASPNRSSYACVTAIRRDSGVPGAGTSTWGRSRRALRAIRSMGRAGGGSGGGETRSLTRRATVPISRWYSTPPTAAPSITVTSPSVKRP